MNRRLLWILVFAAVLVVAVGVGLTRNRTGVAVALPTPTALNLHLTPTITQAAASFSPGSTPAAAPPLAAANLPTRRYSGTLLSASQANLSFQTGGRVQELRVKEGDRVTKGLALMVLDTSMLEIQVRQAQAAFDLAKAGYDKVKEGPTRDDVAVAKSNLDRAKATLDQAQAAYDRIGGASNPQIGMTQQSAALAQAYSGYQAAAAQYNQAVGHPTDTEVRTAQAQLDQAQAALDLAKQNLANATLVAPLDGTVTILTPKIGESVAPGATVATVADLSRMQVQVSLDESSLSSVKLNQPATLTLDALGNTSLTGHVSRIAQNGTTTGGVVSIPVTIDVDSTNAPIYPGLSANVQFQGGVQ